MLDFRYRAVGMSTIGGFWIDEGVVLYYFLPCISRIVCLVRGTGR